MANKLKNMGKYWKDVSKNYLTEKDQGLSAVMYRGMPQWFNAFFSHFQKGTFNCFTKDLLKEKNKILDVGCGTGRWTQVMSKLNSKAKIIGIDLEPERLKIARKINKNSNISFFEGNLSNLGFKDSSFDFVSSVTVLQHIPPPQKTKAIKELCRVTQKGGHILIMELIDTFDDAAHVFPLKVNEWVKNFEENECLVVKIKGFEYTPLIRLLRFGQYLITKKKTIQRHKGKIKLGNVSLILLRIAIALSYPIEFICIKVLPPNTARHVAILFQKNFENE